ncbi:hypothetical protein D3C73_1045700 [compost metagenome]
MANGRSACCATTRLTSAMTANGNRMRFSNEPPHSSLRVLVAGDKKFCKRNPCAPCISIPSKPASIPRRVASPNALIISKTSSPASARGVCGAIKGVAFVKMALELTTSALGIN